MNKESIGMLPPCKVCGAKASGLHYGIITCEACKAFFRRSLARGADAYECSGQRSCKVSYDCRSSCAYCRYQKCVSVGMSPEAVKIGRHTYRIKTANIIEVKKLRSELESNEFQAANSSEEISKHNIVQHDITSNSNEETCSSSLHNTIGSGIRNSFIDTQLLDYVLESNCLDKSQMKNLSALDFQQNSNLSNSDCSDTQFSSDYSNLLEQSLPVQYASSEFINGTDYCEPNNVIISNNNINNSQFDGTNRVPDIRSTRAINQSDSNLDFQNQSCISSNSDESLEHFEDTLGSFTADEVDILLKNLVFCDKRKDSKPLYDPSKVECYESVIQELITVGKQLKGDQGIPGETLSEDESKYLEFLSLKSSIFGSLKTMSIEEYMKFYNQTGIDIDGRRQLMETQILPSKVFGIKQLLWFSSAIPGFCDLSTNDQMSLTRTARFDAFLLGRHPFFKLKHRIYSTPAGEVMHAEDFRKFKGDVIESVFSVISRIQSLQLTLEESAILVALSIMSPAAVVVICVDSEIENRSIVETSNDFLLECLFYLFDKHFPQDLNRFSKTISCLTQLRTVREENFQAEKHMVDMLYGLSSDYSQLLYPDPVAAI